MDFKNYFPTSNKRVLSDQSENEEESKKLREGSVASNPESNEDVFLETRELDANSEIVTENQSVEDALRDLQAKMVEMFKLTQKTNESQIKGEQQLIDLTKSVKYISEQFDEYEKDRKEKEEIIKILEGKVNNLTEAVAKLVKETDNHEQYSRRNCLLVHGLPENTLENTDDLAFTMFKNEMMTLADRIELGSKRMTPIKLDQLLINSRGIMTETRFSEIKSD